MNAARNKPLTKSWSLPMKRNWRRAKVICGAAAKLNPTNLFTFDTRASRSKRIRNVNRLVSARLGQGRQSFRVEQTSEVEHGKLCRPCPKRKASVWSKPAKWSMGLLKASDWKAQWIG